VGSNGLIQTAASDVPRFDHNPATGESLGLLVEEARTNTLTYSEQFDNAAWLKVNATVTANQAIAPDGTLTMDELVDDATSGTHRFAEAFTPPSSNFTISAYVKYTNSAWVYLHYFMYGCAFNIQTGVVGTPTANAASPSIIPMGNGVYRISVNITNNVGSDGVGFGLSTGNSVLASYVGTGSSAFVWGLQVEAGSFPTSYIPTTTATVTRAADVASMTGTNFSSWYNNSEGTFLATIPAVSLTYNLRYLIDCGSSATSGAGASGHVLFGNLNNTNVAGGVTDVSNDSVAGPSAAYTGNIVRVSYAYKVNNFNAAVNGTLGTLDTSGAIPTLGAQQLVIGSRFNGTLYINRPIARLAFYPVRFPDAQLQALTAT
jgi:hypothetical protein